MWTGQGKHLIDAPTSLVISLASSWLCSVFLTVVLVLVLIIRRSRKRSSIEEHDESFDHARISETIKKSLSNEEKKIKITNEFARLGSPLSSDTQQV